MRQESGSGDAQLPSWLQGVATPTEEEFAAWDEREGARERAVEMLSLGLLGRDAQQQAEGYRLLGDLAPVGHIGADADTDTDSSLDLLDAALSGLASTKDLIQGLQSGQLQLTDAQSEFVQRDATHVRVLALSIRLDIGPELLENQLFPDGERKLSMAARGSAGSADRLAAWLEEHPQFTGVATGTHWRA